MSFGFGLQTLRKFPELIPLVTIISVACVGASYFSFYSLRTKPDVQINKKNPFAPWEDIKATEKRKFVVRNDMYEVDAELEKLRKEIGSYRR